MLSRDRPGTKPLRTFRIVALLQRADASAFRVVPAIALPARPVAAICLVRFITELRIFAFHQVPRRMASSLEHKAEVVDVAQRTRTNIADRQARLHMAGFV